ncbi:alpha-2-macroglobulin family protein [Sedimentitalea sp. HM32M-2]|uniref:alpha-2-macroglobulin family protein n=1 Tax=Sedimentitalea sp. HM32M-2 TaxID=3351566 RepID=UPI00363EF56A
MGLRFAVCVFVWAVTAIAVSAEPAVPDYRYVTTRDTDFHGRDLEPLFETDLTRCARACTLNPDCTGFTFNSRASACFPKRAVERQSAYPGAISAIKTATDGTVLRSASARRDQLAFLGDAMLDAAAIQARDLGLRHAAGGADAKLARDTAQARRAAGRREQAAAWAGVATVLSDGAADWADYAESLLAVHSDRSDAARRLAERAAGAAINAYLRALDPDSQADALRLLAPALQRLGRGRDSIPALRLAQSTAPRADTAEALRRAVGKYGFRVQNSTVESDSAAPRICAEFSEPLVRAGVDYEPFVQMPAAGLVVQAEGSQLCIDGVEHGKRYRVTLRAGLPAASGEALAEDVELTHYVRDRGPLVRFPGRAYVLPRSADAALPIETVNLDRVELRLRRISDRNLLRAVQDGYFGRPLSQWQEQTFAGEIAEEIWTGSATVGNTLNRAVTTRLPMSAAIAGRPAGIYALTARVPGADPYDDPGATQWFVLSDLGISSLSGSDGMHVTVRGLADARPRAGVAVTLVSRANAVLGRAVTDNQGQAHFPPGLSRGTGGAAPALLLAEQADADIGFLSLTDPAFDLSDRGVAGRPAAGPVDVFLTTDRGAYRAGETVHVTALARDGDAVAIEGLPLIAVLSRPDGVEYLRRVTDGGVGGGHVFALPIGADAPRGTWRLQIKSDPKAPALASQSLLVEDFLPERIDFDLALPDAALRPTDRPVLRIAARYLFGAPGADLAIEGEVSLRPADTLAAWPGYRFGRHDAPGRTVSQGFSGQRTDARGQAGVALDLPQAEPAGRPMQLTVTARLSDGSARPVERQLTAPVQPGTAVIGVKPLFDGMVPEGGEAGFQVIGLAPDLAPLPLRVRWTLNRVETRYQWYQLYGNWNWEPTTRRSRIATGEATLNGPLTLNQPVEWGEYELLVERLDGDYAATSVSFHAGWYAPADASSTPDRLQMSLDRDSYRPGDTARLRIVAGTAGMAQVAVMSHRLIHRQEVAVEAGETVIPLPVTADWGTGAYVSAAVIRPMDAAAGQNPTRALGLVHARIEPVGKRLQVAIDVPDVAEPRQTQRARIAVTGAAAGEEVWLTLAAVDLGILNLTGFASPDPSGHYFGQRRLGMELRDVYGRLIDGMNGALGAVRSGGDVGAAMRLQSPPPTQALMATFSGPVQVGPEGETFVNIDLPAFNGTVRLMAVAWSRSAVGQAEADMVVRDPVVVTASLPTFLAPGDSSRIRLDVRHADGPAGAMRLALAADDAVLRLGAAPDAFELAAGGKAVFEVPITAVTVGDSAVELVLTTPDGRALRQSLTVPVRSNDPVVARTRRFALDPGGTFAFSGDVLADLRPGTGKALLSAGPLAKFDAPGLLAMLDRYPYGCTEQVTSQALPLLYLSSVAQAAGLGDGPRVAARLEAAIARVLTRQAANGAFGLWRAEPGDFWLDAYVTDFLSRARAQGHAVPARAFGQALDNLRNRINYAPDFDSGGEDIAYGLMVLAREGQAAMGDLRYYADVKAQAFATPLAAAQLGAALAFYGDPVRADAMFARAGRMIEAQKAEPHRWRSDYGTGLRDAAGVLALAAEAGSQTIDTDRLSDRIGRADAPLSTQEAAWSLLAAQALVAAPGGSGLLVDGQPATGPFVEVVHRSSPPRNLAIRAADGQATEITLTTLGVPLIAPEAGGTGYAISRSYYTLQGAPVDGNALAVGDRVVTVLRVTPVEKSAARLIIDDPLPAGVEIDNPNLLRAGDVRALDWLTPSVAEHAEFRSDRFVAAVDLRGADSVTLAYIARAVTPGRYHHPAASVQDMYRPRYRARTATGRMLVTE